MPSRWWTSPPAPTSPPTCRSPHATSAPAGCRPAATWSSVVSRVLGNPDVVLCWAAATEDSDLYRNAIGDELVYIHDGEATLETSFGALAVTSGDYVVIPRGTTHRWVLGGDRLDVLVFEAGGHVRFPERYLSSRGQLKEGAPFSERDLRGPGEPLLVDGTDVPVLVRNRAGLSRLVHAQHPFDVVGWDGCLYPHALSIHDFEPIAGAIHQPPPVHQTFAGPGFVVCSFVPRPYDFHPDAVKVPYHHANTDSDEVLFYAGGDFMSRAGLGHRRGVDLVPPCRLRPRPPARQLGALGRPGPHRGAGRHARHLPPPRRVRRRPRRQRPRLPRVLDFELNPPLVLAPDCGPMAPGSGASSGHWRTGSVRSIQRSTLTRSMYSSKSSAMVSPIWASLARASPSEVK